jgi:hypothetical protein
VLKKSKIRLLIAAAVLTVAALQTAATAQAQCVFYCWHGAEGEACCQTWDCSIIC